MHFSNPRAHRVPFTCTVNFTILWDSVESHVLYLKKLCPGKYLQYNFIRCSLIHPHNTRASTSENYYIKYSRTNQLSNSVAIFGAKLWNCFPFGIRRLPFLALQLYMNTEWQFLYISLRNCHQKQLLRCLAFQSFSFIDNTSLYHGEIFRKQDFDVFKVHF